MQASKLNPSTGVLIIFVLALGAVRVLLNFSPQISSLANFSPLGAMALFGGASFNRQWKAYAFPLLTVFASDAVLSLTVFKQYSSGILYSGWYWVYGALALMVLVGTLLLKKATVLNILLSSLVVVFIHWVVTDLGMWLNGSIYPKTWQGWTACLTAAIPFEMSFFAGTLAYSAVLFGALEWIKRHSALTQNTVSDI